MIKEIIATGATIEAAVENAKAALGAPATADVKVEIIEQPKKKVLGLFGGSPAKARASYEIPDEKPKAAPAERKAQRPAPAERKQEKKQGSAPAEKPQAAKKKGTQKPERPAKPERAPKQEKAEKSADKPTETKITEQAVKETADYLTAIIKGMGIEKCDVSYSFEGSDIMLDLDCGDDYGVVIGRRGETLDAIQYLTRLAANKISKEFVRVSINIGNYREKREKTLKGLASKKAADVLKYGRNVSLEPMNPYERRIIHTAIQEIEGVNSHSVGSDTERRVVITLAEGFTATDPDSYRESRNRGGRNNNRNGGRGGRGGHGGRSRGDYRSEPKTQAPQREPRTDEGAQKVSLYGKLN